MFNNLKLDQNPQQLVLNLLENQFSNSPFGANLLNLAKQGNTQQIEAIVRNYSKSQGIDFDKEFASFCQMLGIK